MMVWDQREQSQEELWEFGCEAGQVWQSGWGTWLEGFTREVLGVCVHSSTPSFCTFLLHTQWALEPWFLCAAEITTRHVNFASKASPSSSDVELMRLNQRW